MTLFSIFQALEAAPFSAFIRKSGWLFPLIESAHILSLTLLMGTIIMVDLSLLGLLLPEQATHKVHKEIQPWSFGALIITLITGFLLFSVETTKLYSNQAFQMKMILLFGALLLTYSIRNPLIKKEKHGQRAGMIIGLLSFSLWVLVAIAGRTIGAV